MCWTSVPNGSIGKGNPSGRICSNSVGDDFWGPKRFSASLRISTNLFSVRALSAERLESNLDIRIKPEWTHVEPPRGRRRCWSSEFVWAPNYIRERQTSCTPRAPCAPLGGPCWPMPHINRATRQHVATLAGCAPHVVAESHPNHTPSTPKTRSTQVQIREMFVVIWSSLDLAWV